WDFEYNTRRPHQSLGGRTPMQIYVSEYRSHAFSRMLT
ncbi:MAG: transposase, partial [Deltaproteobacteria bacterium]|nr:transposase [Deltaproteobacteria bacterium]